MSKKVRNTAHVSILFLLMLPCLGVRDASRRAFPLQAAQTRIARRTIGRIGARGLLLVRCS